MNMLQLLFISARCNTRVLEGWGNERSKVSFQFLSTYLIPPLRLFIIWKGYFFWKKSRYFGRYTENVIVHFSFLNERMNRVFALSKAGFILSVWCSWSVFPVIIPIIFLPLIYLVDPEWFSHSRYRLRVMYSYPQYLIHILMARNIWLCVFWYSTP